MEHFGEDLGFQSRKTLRSFGCDFEKWKKPIEGGSGETLLVLHTKMVLSDPERIRPVFNEQAMSLIIRGFLELVTSYKENPHKPTSPFAQKILFCTPQTRTERERDE